MGISIWNYRFYMLHRRTFLKKDLELTCFDHYPDWNTGATGYYFRNYEPAFMMNQSSTQNARSFPNKSEHTILLNKQLTPSKQHISAFRALILKNLVSFGKIFQFPAIRVLLEVASSNSLEVMS